MNDRQAFRIKKFMRQLLIADKKHRAKERAKEDLEDQIERLKIMLAEKDSGKKYDIEAEMNDLKQKIQNLMDVDSKLLSKDAQIEQKSNSMEKNIMRLDNKLDDYLRYRESRSKRIEQIEKKIQKRLGLTKEHKEKVEFVAKLEKKVNEIEDKLLKMKIDGRVSKRKALELRKRIKSYRKKIAKIKGL